MMSAWRFAADSGGIFFYLIGRTWAAVFGASATSLRLFNAAAIWSALALLWIVARRWYRMDIVAFSLPFCWLTCKPILQQLMIGRFYGLLIAAVACVILAYVRTSDRRTPPLALVGVFLANTLLVGVHPTGCAYSATLLLTMIAYDLARHTTRPQLYVATLAGWLLLVPSITAMKASAAVGNPHFWTTTPTWLDLKNAIFFWTDEIEAVAIVLILCLAFRWIRTSQSPSQDQSPNADQLPLILGAALMLVIPVIWLRSLFGTSYFVDRYLSPTVIGASLLLCASLHRLIPANRTRMQSLSLAGAAFAAACGTAYSAVWDFPAFFTTPPHTYTKKTEELLPQDRPIVIERVDLFVETLFCTPELPAMYLFDWPSVSSPTSPRGDVSGYREMENWKRAGYHASALQSSDDFLSKQDDFWVVSDPHQLWFATNIQHNPSFIAEKVGEFAREREDIQTVWHVRRKAVP